LLVGIREDINTAMVEREGAVAGGFLPEPTRGYPDLEDLLGDLVDDNYENGGTTAVYPSDPRTPLQEALRFDPVRGKVFLRGESISDHHYSFHSPKVSTRFQSMRSNGGQIPESLRTKKFAQRLLPGRWGPNGPTITATSLPDDYVHFAQPRTLTVREWARLQLFPDWYIFHGKRTTGGVRRAGNPRVGNFDRELPKYTQIGNAVPVGLAEAVGRHFVRILEQIP
jgi:DNA (cytosine-5)-methyltransferase 1